MKNLKKAIVGIGIMGCAVTALNAQIVTLTDKNSTASINTSSQAGMYSWNVEPGGVSQLAQQWFWYRVGNGQQYSIDTISAPIISSTANSLVTTYMNNSFSISITYSLTGAGIGTGQADIQEGIQITNRNASSPLNLSFFEYNHFTLNGPSGGAATLSMDTSSALQSVGPNQIAEGIVAPDASHHEANTFGGLTSTLYNLNSTPGYNLNDNSSASGDVTWAFQWDFSVVGSQSIQKDKLLSIQFVPEPSVAGLAALGLGLHLLRRRSRR
jgi:hypothetical protein